MLTGECLPVDIRPAEVPPLLCSPATSVICFLKKHFPHPLWFGGLYVDEYNHKTVCLFAYLFISLLFFNSSPLHRDTGISFLDLSAKSHRCDIYCNFLLLSVASVLFEQVISQKKLETSAGAHLGGEMALQDVLFTKDFIHFLKNH